MIFTRLLGDSNDLVQEVSSRGLVEVYEHGGKEIKVLLLLFYWRNFRNSCSEQLRVRIQDGLVNSLVDTLSTGATGFKMSDKSELFPKG